jgi:hypothetical protein
VLGVRVRLYLNPKVVAATISEHDGRVRGLARARGQLEREPS